MQHNTKNLLDLLQDSINIKDKKNLLPKLINYQKNNQQSIVDQLLKLGAQQKSSNSKRKLFSQDPEVVKSKISEISLKIRKEHRQYDKAFLLESLTESALKKNSCLLALKLKEGNQNQSTYLDSMNKIITLRSNCQIVELLISLSDTLRENNEYQMSDFGVKFLHKKIRNQVDTVLPDKSDYVNSDSFLIDRDKSTTAFFISYDNTSFEGKSLLNSQVEFQKQMTSQNRFNQALFFQPKDANQNMEPTPLMGALSRIQNNNNDYSNPFNISFEIPPLPALPNISDQQSGQAEIPSFFTNIYNQSEQLSAEKSSPIQWQSKSPKSNRRQVKQKYKKQNKRQLLWSLMPYVDESLLPHNIDKESGIKRLWEDEQLDIKMRDLKVSENGLLTLYKALEFQREYNHQTETVVQVPGTMTFNEQEVVNQSLLMLQGIPSSIFLLEKSTFTFSLRDNFQITHSSINKELMESIFEEMMVAGSSFLHLKEFEEFMSNPLFKTGQILENFVLAIQEFIAYYQNEINNVKKNVEERRDCENKEFFKYNQQENLRSEMTLLELRIHLSSLITQIRVLATICFTQKFIHAQQLPQEDQQMLDADMNKSFKQINTYNNKNLATEFQLNMERLRTQHWLKDFPNGAKLLTYLYKIIICCESDLQAIDLLRRIFQKAIEPLLQMINIFIFTGDFTDPFQEFFVEKIYRQRLNKEDITDYMFKMTSDQDKIPAFLTEIAHTIFKTGSSVGLLKTGKIKGMDEKQLNEYYQICCGDSINKFYTKLVNKDMNLDFHINTLRISQEKTQKAFQLQAERLQEIELKIVQEEEEIFYRQILLREEARREYLIKQEFEKEEELRYQRERQESMMKGIQLQIEEKQKKKEQERLDKIKENEQIRKEQDEYERKKIAIAEELKRQYLEVLKQNQKLGDMRKQEVIAEEQLENEIKQIIEENKDDPLIHEEIPQSQEQKEDVEMIVEDENNQLQPEEQAFISSETNHNLLQILNENEQQETIIQNLDQDQQQQPIIEDKADQQELLTLEEIQFIQQPTLEDKLNLVQNLFIEPLLKNVFQRIDQKRQMETKRRTWMSKRKQEKIKKVQDRRSNWKYQEPAIPIRERLNQIFDQFQTQDDKSNKKNDKLEIFNVPTALAIRQCVIQVVKDQNKIVNKCLLHMMYRKLNLLKHLEALKQIYFCYQGDVISIFMQTLFNDDFESTVKENSIAFINEQLEMSIKLSIPVSQNLNPTDQFGINVLAQNFIFGINTNNESAVLNSNFYFTVFNMQDYVSLLYKRDYPLDMVISHQCLQKYNQIFFFLIKLKRINQILGNLWKDLNSSEFRRLSLSDSQKIRRIQLLRSKMQHFISMMEQYALTEVIEASWKNFKDSLTRIQDFEDLIKLHNDFLDQILVKCFIDKKDHKVMGLISNLYEFVNKLNKLVKEYGATICYTKEAINEIRIIEEQFDKYTQFLYKLVKSLAFKGQFKELYLRLDFNKYYDKDSQQQFI